MRYWVQFKPDSRVFSLLRMNQYITRYLMRYSSTYNEVKEKSELFSWSKHPQCAENTILKQLKRVSRLEQLVKKSFKIMSRSVSVKSTSETFKSIPICQICASDGNVAIVNKRMNARFFCCCKNAQFASPFFAMELRSIWKLGKLTMFAASIGSVAQSHNSFLNWAQFRARAQSHNLFLDVSWAQIMFKSKYSHEIVLNF